MHAAAALFLTALASVAPAIATDRGGEAALARAIGNRVAGKPVDCISPRDATSVQVVDGTAIIYRDGSRLYVNRPQGGGASLRNDDILITRIEGGQLCRLDSITLGDVTSRIPRGFVILGAFVPYDRPR